MSDMTEALLGCPFCGGEAEYERLGTPHGSTIVACTQCGCRLESAPPMWDQAMDWNRRSAIASRQPVVKPLEWQSKVYGDGSERHTADNRFGAYSLHVPRKDLGPEVWASAPLSEVRWNSLDAAKAAAQADYTQRILSALTKPEDSQ